jgi:hypothetical protein
MHSDIAEQHVASIIRVVESLFCPEGTLASALVA